MEYTVNGVKLKYEAIGSKGWGKNVILLDDAFDLTKNTTWHQRGFTIDTLFDEETFRRFSEKTESLLLQCWKDAGLIFGSDFQLNKYHTLVTDFKSHLRAIEKTKLLQTDDFPVPIKLIEDRISEVCQVPLIARNPFDGEAIFHFRVIRPNHTDNNPLHRDVWLEDYDDCINLYIPVAGSDERSSLILIPESHRWPESRIEKTEFGAEINGVKFNVPAVTAIAGEYSIERPCPIDNQVLVFSPYLVHGGAVNINCDKTRISIELRLWKK